MIAEFVTSESVQIEHIEIPKGRRDRHGQAFIESLADSIRENGLLQPIRLTSGYRLIAGMGRILAHEHLNLKTIRAEIVETDDLRAELAEIDENLIRNELTKLERGEQLARRKEIYEAMHPETKAGVSQGRGMKASACKADLAEQSSARSFAEDVAEKTGQSERNIRKDIEVATKLTDAAKDAIKGTPVADNRSQLKQLADLPPAEQEQAAVAIKSGAARTVAEATAKPEPESHGIDLAELQVPYKEAVAALNKIKREFKAIADTESIGVHIAVVLGRIVKGIDDAKTPIAQAMPMAVCKFCNGKRCNRCGKMGWHTKATVEGMTK